MGRPKKDFSGIKSERVYDAIEQSTAKKQQQGTASPQEQNARKEALETQGRKGCRATRINMAFTPANHYFIKRMARINGVSMTVYANAVIRAYREEHPELLEMANKIIDEVMGASPIITDEEREAGDDHAQGDTDDTDKKE